MKKVCSVLMVLSLVAFSFTSCQQKPMDDATMNMKADSVAKARMTAVSDSMMKDCEAHSADWIKMKADSIYKADSAAMASMK